MRATPCCLLCLFWVSSFHLVYLMQHFNIHFPADVIKLNTHNIQEAGLSWPSMPEIFIHDSPELCDSHTYSPMERSLRRSCLLFFSEHSPTALQMLLFGLLFNFTLDRSQIDRLPWRFLPSTHKLGWYPQMQSFFVPPRRCDIKCRKPMRRRSCVGVKYEALKASTRGEKMSGKRIEVAEYSLTILLSEHY